jgi:ABC-type nickel/cobalt efflux system permease component RcnA
MSWMAKHLAVALVLWAACSAAQAHPVPKRVHDRTISVRLSADSTQVDVTVAYRLEADPFTIIFDDLPAVAEQVDLKKLRQPLEFYRAFTESYAPILAGNLVAGVDDRPLTFRCQSTSFTLRDERGVDLNHVRCDFVFVAHLPLSASAPNAHEFRFHEGNYELEEGRIDLSLVPERGVRFETKIEPDALLKSRPPAELRPGDDGRLRMASARFIAGGVDVNPPSTAEPGPPSTLEGKPPESTSLLSLLVDSRQGILMLLLLASGFGAVHALTPGHGKTLVAAYLVGERGTIGHAFFLGLVTTITHTGAVLVIAAGLLWFFPSAVPRDIQMVLGLGGGLLVAGMGLWLFLRRLAGGADHIHLGPAHHHHDTEHEHTHLPPAANGVGLWSLIVLGVSGGIVPCWDAILMLGWAIGTQRLWLGLPLLLAFSAGLAGVLIAIGIAVVYLKGFASSRWGESRLVRALPLVSAGLVTIMGLWLCYDTAHLPSPAPASVRVAQQ